MCVNWGLPAHSPIAQTFGCGCLQALVDLYISLIRKLDPRELQADAVRIRSAASGDKKIGAFDDLIRVTLPDMKLHRLSGHSFHERDRGIHQQARCLHRGRVAPDPRIHPRLL